VLNDVRTVALAQSLLYMVFGGIGGRLGAFSVFDGFGYRVTMGIERKHFESPTKVTY
jgi:hypothetical protein